MKESKLKVHDGEAIPQARHQLYSGARIGKLQFKSLQYQCSRVAERLNLQRHDFCSAETCALYVHTVRTSSHRYSLSCNKHRRNHLDRVLELN